MRVVAAERTFPGSAQSVPEARRYVRSELARLGADAAADDALSLVSELATNAVLHAHTDFTVSVQRHDAAVRVCVQDGSPVSPRARSYDLDATTGRGMRLVLAMAQSWGVDLEPRGKVVWFELPAGGATTDDVEEQDEDVISLLERYSEPDSGSGPVARAA